MSSSKHVTADDTVKLVFAVLLDVTDGKITGVDWHSVGAKLKISNTAALQRFQRLKNEFAAECFSAAPKNAVSFVIPSKQKTTKSANKRKNAMISNEHVEADDDEEHDFESPLSRVSKKRKRSDAVTMTKEEVMALKPAHVSNKKAATEADDAAEIKKEV